MKQLQKMKNKIGTWFQLENMFKPERINSAAAVFGILLVFLIGVATMTIAKLFHLQTATVHPLFTNKIDILPAYKTNFTLFSAIVSIEFLHLITGALMAYFFLQFLRSIDLKDPFKNVKSKFHISIVAKLSVLLLFLDFANRNLIQTMSYENGNSSQIISLFNIEYFILLDLLFVFAIIFRYGIDLKNEMDLVV